jgi:hypothetical protein
VLGVVDDVEDDAVVVVVVVVEGVSGKVLIGNRLGARRGEGRDDRLESGMEWRENGSQGEQA